MPGREDDAKRRRAFAEGLLPLRHAASRELPGGETLEAHEAGPGALGRIAVGEQTAWDVLAAEALGCRCSGKGCAVADGDIESCPGWCATAIAGSGERAMASRAGPTR